MPTEELIDSLNNLVSQVQGLRREVGGLKTRVGNERSERRKSTRRGAILIAIGLGLGLWNLGLTSAVDHQSTEAVRLVCESRNEQNDRQISLWEGVILLDRTDPPDPVVVEQFRELLYETFPQFDC